jgi:hypothetical protein
MGKDPDPAKDAETQRKKSETMKALWKNRAFQKRQSQGVVDKWQEPEYQGKISSARKKQHEEGKGGRGGGTKRGKGARGADSLSARPRKRAKGDEKNRKNGK